MKYIWRKHSHWKSSTSIIHPPVPRTTRHLEMHLCDRLGRFIRRAEANEAEALRGPRHGRFPLRPAMKNPEIPELRGTNKINQDLGMLSPKMWAFPKMWLFGTTWCKSLFNFTTVYPSVNSHCDTPEKYPGSPSILLLWQVFRWISGTPELRKRARGPLLSMGNPRCFIGGSLFHGVL